MPKTAELSRLTKDELYELARKRQIEGRSQMDKGELIEALEAEEGNGSKRNGGKGGRAPKTDEPEKSNRAADRPTTTNRSIWRGAITFGLITIPVGLYTAIEDRDISFRLLSGKDGSRIRYKRVSAETGKEVDWDDIVKGYEYEKGRYVTFTNEELDRLPSDSIRAIDVVQFVREDDLDPIYFDRSYYVAPEESAIKAYRVLVEALQRSERVGIGKVTIREKERLCTLRAKDGVLVLETMNWPDEIRIPAFEQLERQVEVSPQEVEMAQSLIDHLTQAFEPEAFRDSYRERLEEAISKKIEGEEIQLAPEAEPEPEGVTDLLAALRASVEATRAKRSA